LSFRGPLEQNKEIDLEGEGVGVGGWSELIIIHAPSVCDEHAMMTYIIDVYCRLLSYNLHPSKIKQNNLFPVIVDKPTKVNKTSLIVLLIQHLYRHRST
jgi:hypothetical protein